MASDEDGPVNDELVGNPRDIILLDEKNIAAGRPDVIEIKPSKEQGRCLLHRIVMHKSCAGKLALVKIEHAGRIRSQGSGSCEIFLAEVPNWTPQNIYISEAEPLRLHVVNRNPLPLFVVGSAIVFRKEVR
jgi:hypothetical protein